MTAPAPPKRDPSKDASARRRGLAPVSAVAARVTAPLLKKRGLAEARIVTEWPAIVGDLAARRSAPERLLRARKGETGGTLRLRVAGAWALEFQHIAPDLLARINGYFGYPAVARLQLVQAPLPADRAPPPRPRPLTAEAESRLAARAAKIEDPDLRARVMALGRALERRAASPDKARRHARNPV